MSPSNKFELVPGVTLDLKQAKEDYEFTLGISEDIPKIAGKVKTLVDAINGVLEFINKQNTVDDTSDTRTTFTGDSGLQAIEYRIRNLMHEGFPIKWNEDEDEYQYMWANQIGIEFTKNGMLTFNKEKFTKTAETDMENVVEMISGEHGFATQMKAGIISLGLSFLRGEMEHLLPWAWSINGAFSVIATPLANIIILSMGYKIILALSIVFYIIVFMTCPNLREKN